MKRAFDPLQKSISPLSGDSLRAVSFPLGGIGTGTVGLGGRGQLDDFEILNHPAKGCGLPFAFFALWWREGNNPPAARILERQFLPPYQSAHGISPSRLGGLPRFHDAEFTGEYPFAWLRLADGCVPLKLQLRAWNPMVPHDTNMSGIPAALFDWTAENTSYQSVELAIAFCMPNPVGWDGSKTPGSRRERYFGGNLNTVRSVGHTQGVLMTGTNLPSDNPLHGSMAIGVEADEAEAFPCWRRGPWFDDAQWFWDRFRANGSLERMEDQGPTPEGETDIATVIARVQLEPGASSSLPFTLAWSFPNLHNTWNTETAVAGKPLGNYYAIRYPDAWSVVELIAAERDVLEARTADFHEALFDSTLPSEVLEAVSANMSIVRTTTVTRTADGRMNAFEGCNDGSGCCPMNCTHVWNYAQAVAALYPELERTVRNTDFAHNTDTSGKMSFRTLLPLIGEQWAFRPAADGQMGTLLRLYREWLACGDDDWLKRLWPAAKNSLEFAWSKNNPDGWDLNRDGVMEGIQHNTYDIEFCGPNTLMGSWYLAALRAGAEMAEHLGEKDLVAEYRALAERGATGHDTLWNGEYYEQKIQFDPEVQSAQLSPISGMPPVEPDGPRYQYGTGCLSDQLTGQWFAHCVGLGHVFPADKVRKAAQAIVRYNFRKDLSAHESLQRTYALNDEPGLLMCSWPNGGKPSFPFPYADEVWTGIEYSVAALLIYEGFVDDALEIVRAVRSRQNGANRNPWDECECGHHYARAMSSWSLLTALSGFHYSAPNASIRFAPRMEGHFRCFYAAGGAWGTYERTGETQSLKVVRGTLTLRRWDNAQGPATLNGAGTVFRTADTGLVFDESVQLTAGDVLRSRTTAT